MKSRYALLVSGSLMVVAFACTEKLPSSVQTPSSQVSNLSAWSSNQAHQEADVDAYKTELNSHTSELKKAGVVLNAYKEPITDSYGGQAVDEKGKKLSRKTFKLDESLLRSSTQGKSDAELAQWKSSTINRIDAAINVTERFAVKYGKFPYDMKDAKGKTVKIQKNQDLSEKIKAELDNNTRLQKALKGARDLVSLNIVEFAHSK